MIITNPNDCDGIQTVSLGATKASIDNEGLATITFDAAHHFLANGNVTLTGAGDGTACRAGP